MDFRRYKIKFSRKWKRLLYHLTWMNLFKSAAVLLLLSVSVYLILNYDGVYKQLAPRNNLKITEKNKAKDPNRLEIAKIGLSGKVLYPSSLGELNKSLNQGINHLPESAKPGDIGNVVLTGHSSSLVFGYYSDIFSPINRLDAGDNISLFVENSEIRYSVVQKKIIEKTDMASVNKFKDDRYLTLITCWPLGTDLKRYIVVAKQL